jgi:hypothetical protein
MHSKKRKRRGKAELAAAAAAATAAAAFNMLIDAALSNGVWRLYEMEQAESTRISD